MNARARLWRFASARYARPGVRVALIALQDARGLNVNLLLWRLWRGDGADMHAAGARLAAIAIAPLVRAARRAAKAWSETDDAGAELARALSDDLLALELRAEAIEQAALADLAAPAQDAAYISFAEARAAIDDALALCSACEDDGDDADALARLLGDGPGDGRGSI